MSEFEVSSEELYHGWTVSLESNPEGLSQCAAFVYGTVYRRFHAMLRASLKILIPLNFKK